MDASKLDLVLVEGFKHEPVPKIPAFRQNSGHRVEELVIDEHTIAVASDVSIATSLPLLDLNDVPPDRDIYCELVREATSHLSTVI